MLACVERQNFLSIHNYQCVEVPSTLWVAERTQKRNSNGMFRTVPKISSGIFVVKPFLEAKDARVVFIVSHSRLIAAAFSSILQCDYCLQ